MPLKDVPLGLWILSAALALMLGLIIHAAIPRYEYTLMPDGAVLIHDRWAGQFQRAVYDTQGTPTLQTVLKPF